MKQGDLFAGVEPEPVRPERPAAPAARSRPAPSEPADAAERRSAVTCFDRPLLLEAGAGTGKTATLVARVVHWCTGPGWDAAREPDDLPEDVALRVLRGVAAITFTEAAAAEMSTRVGRALAKIQRVAAAGALATHELDPDELPPGLVLAELPGDPGVLAQRARALRAALDHLNVSTIHAFCRRLLAAHPLEVDLDPGFEVDATFSEVVVVVREAVEAWLGEAWAEPVDPDLIALALAGFGPPEIEAAVAELVEAGARAVDFEEDPLGEDVCAELLCELEAAAAELAPTAALLAALRGNTPLAVLALDHTVGALVETAESARARLGALAVALKRFWKEGGARPWNRLKDWGKKLNKGEDRALGERAAEHVAAARRLRSALEPLLDTDFDLFDRARRVIARVFRAAEAELRRRGIATFSDLLFEAGRLLTEHPGVASVERRRLHQLLVDEFQDTDLVQCEIVGRIALDGPPDERPGLFLVGDPKQSIFAWRNADLAAYHAFEERIEAEGGRVLRLWTNFRSRRAILAEVDRAIEPVMEEERGVQPRFAALEAGRPDADQPDREPAVEFWLSWPRGEDGAVDTSSGSGWGGKAASYEAEAAALAHDVIRRRRAEGSSWSDFAVVFRTFTAIEPYLQRLRELDVPYEVQSDRKYYRRREIMDATALVRTVLDPHDVVALVALLRSPMIGVPDAALLPLWERGFPGRLAWLSRPDEERLVAMEELVRTAAARVPASVPGLAGIAGWEESLILGVRAIARARQSFRRDPADAWVDGLRALFLPDATEAARFLGAYRLANLERFFREVLRAVEERAGDVQAILRTLRSSVQREDRSEAARPGDSGQEAVQVLTIHGAKGLEFRHVYLAQTHKQDGGFPKHTRFDRRGGRPAYMLFGSASPAWVAAERLQKEAEAAERVRLLYVAMTRAKDRLVVLGSLPAEHRPKGWRDARNFADLLRNRPGIELAVGELAQRAAQEDGTPVTDEHGTAWQLATEIGAAAPREPDSPVPGAAAAPPLPSAEEIAEESVALARQRADAEQRAARPFHATASAESHSGRAEVHVGRRFAEGQATEPENPGAESPGAGEAGPGGPGGLGRAAAQAVGTEVHRLLEELDLAAPDPAAELAARVAALEERLKRAVAATELEAAVERARELCRRFETSGLCARLASLAQHVVARELTVIAPPAGDGPQDPVAFASGAIDLLYRDPATAELVVADYKTDRAETDAQVAALAEHYAPQGAAYVRAVRSALGLERDPRFELWFLHAGRVV